MKHITELTLLETVKEVQAQDRLDNLGIAKARFASESEYSVPTLERYLRGDVPTDKAATIENKLPTLSESASWRSHKEQ